MNSEVEELIEQFLEKSEQQVSINSFKAYRSDLKLFAQHFDKLSQINQNSLRDVKVKLLEGFSEKTVARRWSSWREFLRFCQLSGRIKSNPILEVKVDSPNALRKLKLRINPETLQAICNYPTQARDRALLWFMYSTGSRPSELFKYGVFKNLNLAAAEFQIADRITFLCKQAMKALEEYWPEREQIVGHKTPALNEAIFINDKGQPLGELFTYTLFSQCARKMGVKATIADLRDSLALRLIQSGASPDELKYFLGFKSVKSIESLLRLDAALRKGISL